jgi:hypothetical protein
VNPHVIEATVEHRVKMRDRKFNLIVPDVRFCLNQIGLGRSKVRKTKIQNLSSLCESVNGFGYCIRPHERTWTVQEQEVEVIGLQLL